MRIEINDTRAPLIYKALEPEISSVPYTKTSTKMCLESPDLLTILVSGEEISALRGSFHTYLNWIKTILDSFEVVS